jgi:hypothetical protein
MGQTPVNCGVIADQVDNGAAPAGKQHEQPKEHQGW